MSKNRGKSKIYNAKKSNPKNSGQQLDTAAKKTSTDLTNPTELRYPVPSFPIPNAPNITRHSIKIHLRRIRRRMIALPHILRARRRRRHAVSCRVAVDGSPLSPGSICIVARETSFSARRWWNEASQCCFVVSWRLRSGTWLFASLSARVPTPVWEMLPSPLRVV